MAYKRIKQEAVSATDMSFEKAIEEAQAQHVTVNMTDMFVETANGCREAYNDMNSSVGDKQSAGEIVAGLHMIGIGLHEELKDLCEKPEHEQIVNAGVLNIFESIAAGKMTFVETPGDPHVIFDNRSNGTGEKKEMTVTEGNDAILRSAICYGIVSGLGRAVAEEMKENL